MAIKTLDEYEKALLPFANSKPELKEAAKTIGKYLFEDQKKSAQSFFNLYAKQFDLVRWEQLAFSDLCAIEKEKLQAGV